MSAETRDFDSAYAIASRAIGSPERLAAVHESGILDTEAEEAFDRLTRLAVRILGVPASFVSLVDENRDFYKSACGFPEPLATARELEGPTFCHFAIQSDSPLVIPDTRADPVYRSVPTVESLGVAAYVGVPLVVNDQRIGSLCVIDVKPREWSDDEITTLRELAAMVQSEISLRAARAWADRSLADSRAANRAKADFLAAMSHDLRTPLNAIGGHAQLIEMGVQGPVTDQQLMSIGRIMRAQRHLMTLIDDILQYAKVESGEVSLERGRVDLQSLCHDLNALIGPMAEERQIAFACDMTAGGDPIIAESDGERILQILINLATNAIKFTQEGGRVEVRGRYAAEVVEIDVSDTGSGITKDNLEKVFEPFVQVGSAQRRREGVGLGLASSRKLARLMGGDIVVTSEPGVGSVFTLRIPRNA